jgi:hypothetical protein
MSEPHDLQLVPTTATPIADKSARGKPIASGKTKPAVLTVPPQRGRPTGYTPEMADLVCRRVLGSRLDHIHQVTMAARITAAAKLVASLS